MKVAVVGAGMTGAYLYRLLDKKRHSIDLFDRKPQTSCGIKPCAWGTSNGFSELVKASGLDPSDYILKKTDHVIIDGLKIAAALMTIDKGRLIGDLLAGADVSDGQPEAARYDRIIDATGVARSLLPPVQDDIILHCAQWRVERSAPLENRVQLGKIGYGWSFPLLPREYHIGCGSLIADPDMVMEEIGWLGDGKGNTRCACQGTIRLTGPCHSQPFVAVHGPTEVWGVGEAIGCVAPLAGDGILSGMRSAQLLLEYWNDSSGYTAAILKEFRWMEDERRIIEKLRRSKPLGISDARVLKRNARRMEMQVGLREAATLLRNLR